MTFNDLVRMFEERVANRWYGKYEGVVENVTDPLEIGRVQVRVPEVFGEELISGWALPCSPFGGGMNRGLYLIPDVGDTVWVEFAAGDTNRPIWSGAFWGAPDSAGGQDDLGTDTGAEAPQGADTHAAPGQHVLRTRAGHLISMDDDGGVVVIAEGSGTSIRMNADGEVIVSAQTIKLGSEAAEKLVLGDAFKQLFNSHTHPTGVGPSGVPAQALGDSHLSNVSKTE